MLLLLLLQIDTYGIRSDVHSPCPVPKWRLVRCADDLLVRFHTFAPTLFRLGNISWGLCIYYEGLYPYVTGDWSQFDALQKAGVEAVLWSIGGILSDKLLGPRTAGREGTFLYAGELKAEARAFNSSGSDLPRSAVHKVTVDNYTASAAVVVF